MNMNLAYSVQTTHRPLIGLNEVFLTKFVIIQTKFMEVWDQPK